MTAKIRSPWRACRGELISGVLVSFVACALAIAPLPAIARAPVHPAPDPFAQIAGGHEASEGLRLVAAQGETVGGSARCTHGAPVRTYRIAAIAVDITVNRFGDHDPHGRMFVLESALGAVRTEENRNTDARAGRGTYAVSMGLQDDAIQPLVLRVHSGDCLHVIMRNALRDEDASFHLHGSSLVVAGTKLPAIATEQRALARPGKTVTYEWNVSVNEPEGTHYFHSHGSDRAQTSHGLFGALIVEPRDARWLDPETAAAIDSGWAAMIDLPNGPDFREFALIYHEIGDENYQLLDHAGAFVPLVDPILADYRPDGRALNYRSEPFMNRMKLQQDRTGRYDESLAYSSYSFGDPATPLLRTYLGDPVKQRIIHGGSEVFHVHHVHGGAIRWRRQPGEEPSGFATGLTKKPALVPSASERIDSQSIGPSETFDTENECGAGGCQQSAGDFLYHCHVAHHYFAGMWGIWRVYNTLQNGTASTDQLPPLRELPDRAEKMRAGVASETLPVERVLEQLPPQGVPSGYDASVWNWTVNGPIVVGEPNDARSWPGHTATDPKTRPPLLFDPETKRLAYPFMRPHLGARPPFAPNHGPAPFLDPTANGAPLPKPGAHGASSLCPAGTRPVAFRIHAIGVPVEINRKQHLLDPNGQIYVLAGDVARARADPSLRVPLTIRANAQQDCVDVVLTNELPDSPENHHFSKVNLHIHFVQFDVQASDGVITGFNYEQSVRPYRQTGSTLTNASERGAIAASLSHPDRFHAGAVVGIGMGEDSTFETRRIAAITATALRFDRPLDHPHPQGTIVSAEFVRYRWYPDAQTGSAYLHDHVNALMSWQHGLFGALIVEPPGSTYHDPVTGAVLPRGEIADIWSDRPVSADVRGSFRELAMFIQDQQPITHIGRSSGSAIGLRAEPLDARARDPALMFSTPANGDPETPLLRAYVGDPIVVRALVGATNDVHTWHIDGHWFRIEPWSTTSSPVNTAHLGISERSDLVIPAAGGPERMPGDYLYYDGRSFKLREGSWGLIRALGARTSTLQMLPGRSIEARRPAVCDNAREFKIEARASILPMLGREPGEIFASAGAATGSVAPLVLHANVGDCISIQLHNLLTHPVSLHADGVAFDPMTSYGIAAGHDPRQDVPPGATRTYTYFAAPETGPTVAMLRDFADPLTSGRRGLYGAIVVGAPGTSYEDARTGAARDIGWDVVARPASGIPYRDVSIFMQDEDASIGTHRMPYTQHVEGVVGLNYATAPLNARGSHPWDVHGHGLPATPLIEAFAGDPVSLHVLSPRSEQSQVFSVEGHRWQQEPGRAGTNLLSSVQIGGVEAITLDLTAGGDAHLPGDYLYGDHREPYREAGLWGIFRVLDACGSRRDGRSALAGTTCAHGRVLPYAIAIGAIAVLAALGVRRRRYGARSARRP